MCTTHDMLLLCTWVAWVATMFSVACKRASALRMSSVMESLWLDATSMMVLTWASCGKTTVCCVSGCLAGVPVLRAGVLIVHAAGHHPVGRDAASASGMRACAPE